MIQARLPLNLTDGDEPTNYLIYVFLLRELPLRGCGSVRQGNFDSKQEAVVRGSEPKFSAERQQPLVKFGQLGQLVMSGAAGTRVPACFRRSALVADLEDEHVGFVACMYHWKPRQSVPRRGGESKQEQGLHGYRILAIERVIHIAADPGQALAPEFGLEALDSR